MIDRSQKLVEWDFSFPLTGFYGFDKGVNDDEFRHTVNIGRF